MVYSGMGKYTPPPPRERVSIELDGNTYSGAYTVEDAIITVEFNFDRRSAQLGSTPALTLAETMLSELVATAPRGYRVN